MVIRSLWAALLLWVPSPLFAEEPEASEGTAPAEWPKISFDTAASLDYAGLDAKRGPDRGPNFSLRFDSTLNVELADGLSVYGIFQFKPREPLPDDDPNRDLFINQGAGRREGGKMKELYVRYGDWRIGKFVQNFGRGYALLPGPFAADFVEESEEGYEPSDMLGVEKLWVFDNESEGWQQITISLFMADRTFLHESFPFNEGQIHYDEGGPGNTRLPENLLISYDVLNRPVGRLGHLNFQASAIRFGKSHGAERGEIWTTLGADLSIPVNGSVDETVAGRYRHLKFYAEIARRDRFQGIAGRSRTFASGSAEFLAGPLIFDVTATHRWTEDRIDDTRKDRLYSITTGYAFPSQTLAALSFAHESVGSREGIYFGVRLTQGLSICGRCMTRGDAY